MQASECSMMERYVLERSCCSLLAEEFSANRRQQKCDNISMKLFINRSAHMALGLTILHSPPANNFWQLATGNWMHTNWLGQQLLQVG